MEIEGDGSMDGWMDGFVLPGLNEIKACIAFERRRICRFKLNS